MLKTSEEKDIETLSESVLDVLEEFRFLCENTGIPRAWEKAGAKVDYEKRTAGFSRKLIQEFVNDLKKGEEYNEKET